MSFMAGYMLGLADSREPVLTDISVAETASISRLRGMTALER